MSIEAPESIYLISKELMTNWIYMWVPATDISGDIFIPDGCYDAVSMQVVLENAINTTLNTTDFSVIIDPLSKKTIIKHVLGYEFTIVFTNCDSDQKNVNIEQNLGWILGFRSPTYINGSSYVSEGIFSPIPLEYMFFVLNDYSFSNSSNLIAMFYDSYIDKNILAKIPYSNTNFQILFDGNNELLSPKRQYFGPIDIKKISIQLLNKCGRVVDMNHMNFSFTLEVEMVYDI